MALAAFWRLLRPGLSGKRAALWSLATAGALLLTMLHDSFQMITALMAIALLFAMLFWRAGAAGRRELGRRLALLAAASAVVVGPLFVATVMAAYGSGVRLDLYFASFDFQPDLIEFALSPGTSLLFGRLTHAILARFDLVQGIETAIALSWVGLALGVVAVLRGWREARLWAVLTAFFAILSIGPALKVFGRLTFTEYQLPIIIPYTLLTALPGLDFLRTPGVWHQPQPSYEDYRPGSWGEQQAAALVAELFGGRAPDYEDELVRVYKVPPPGASAATEPVLGLQDNWYVREEDWRWARSPATLLLSVPQARAMALELTPDAIYQPGPGQTVGTQGRLRVMLDGVELAAVELTSGETARIPLRLAPGTYTLRLALDAGAFRPSARGSEDARWLSFSIRQLNLVTDQ